MMAFVCQQCKNPLQLDASLVDLAPSAFDMIAAALPAPLPSSARPQSEAEQLARLPSPSSSKAAWQRAAQSNPLRTSSPLSARAQAKQPHREPQAPNDSFVLLQDSVIKTIPSSLPSPSDGKKFSVSRSRHAPTKAAASFSSSEPEPPNPSPLSHHLHASLRLFNLLSSRTDVDHPLCAECTHILLSTLEKQLEETKKERDGYLAFEKEVRKEKERESKELNKADVERTIESLKEEERWAIEKLRETETEREKLEEEMKALELEEKALEEEEAEFWRVHNTHVINSAQQASQLAALRAAYAADAATLEKLERTNVYNDAFCIGHDGVFGTINGLRLGRVPGVPVEWTEINAAWGQTLLLLHTIARKLEFTFENYRLVPMGSFSRIERTTGDKATYGLYGSGDLHIGRLLHNRRFDFAMVAFLECLKQVVDYVKSQDATVEFPHPIIKDKIGEASVKLQFSQEEAWTRALRHILLALKILLKWTTNGANG
ncbi:APG6-domain-containing protein [Gloeophyllum trabeum ATCC 11539]|uniref:APG6-domain-containing protein n=1 Tax=Gloeophyllum trabeum (strain ATCC 11539 / FP-39264 / Madison 617) TaxID=670483 RepID=S7RRD9_GLOTA|nr:APG6-domain-containing protein [Gloeophyllum trabeum ATCC 11539]EPQ57205.1 APG6-domain-containing protein [Gloeophyllum trabeum ATCC 11539]